MRLSKEFKSNCKEIIREGKDKITVTTNRGYVIDITKVYAGFYMLNNINKDGEIYSAERMKDMLILMENVGWIGEEVEEETVYKALD